jgi:sulfonate transport system substrate-binding protein
VLDEFKTLNKWAATHPEEIARLLAKSSGVAYEALLKTEHRHIYEIKPIDAATLKRC